MDLGILIYSNTYDSWKGVQKELLPLYMYKVIDRSIMSLTSIGIRDFVVVTTPDRIAGLANYLKDYLLNITFVLYDGSNPISAIRVASNYFRKNNYVSFMDCFISLDAFFPARVNLLTGVNFTAGIFDNNNPDKFYTLNSNNEFVLGIRNVPTKYHSSLGGIAFTDKVICDFSSMENFLNINNSRVYFYIEKFENFYTYVNYFNFIKNFSV